MNNLAREVGRGQREPVGQLWPNGEFGLSWRPSGRSELVDMSHEEICALQCETGQPIMTEEFTLLAKDGEAIPFDLVSVPNSHKKPDAMSARNVRRAKRGEGGLTSYGKRMVRNAAELLENEYGAKRLSFLTLTLPPMSRSAREESNREWSEMVRQFLQWLSRKLVSAGLPELIVGVTEVQPGRAKETGHRWLHYHAVFLGRHARKGWAVSCSDVRKAWTRIVQNRVEGFSGVCPGENMRSVKGGAGQYLSKYMSKGSDVEGTGELPSSWWNASKSLRDKVKSQIKTGDATAYWLQMLIDEHGEEPAEAFYWLRPVVLWDDEGLGFLIGWTGKLKPCAFP